LNAVKGEFEHLAKSADQEGLSQARNAFEQDVATRKDGDQGAINNVFVADNDLANLSAKIFPGLAEGLDLRFSAHNEIESRTLPKWNTDFRPATDSGLTSVHEFQLFDTANPPMLNSQGQILSGEI
jgi:hypothetical protein